MTNNDTVFIDTSIAIARVVHPPKMKLKIQDRLDSFKSSATSLVVKQEFKRRLLKEAQYLLNQLNDKGNFTNVLWHITSVLPVQRSRKQNICLATLVVIFDTQSEEELTERAYRYLRQLIRLGLNDLSNSVDHVFWGSGCACANTPIIEKKPYVRYEFGSDKCQMVASKCGIADFFVNHIDDAKIIQEKLGKIPAQDKSVELHRAEAFLTACITDPSNIYSHDPCLTVGDLIIALESAGVEFFYTLNSKESQYLCRALEQSLIIRPKNPANSEKVHLKTDKAWDKY